MPEFTPNLAVTLSAEQERIWSNAIGGLILNFGQIEFLSHRWIQHFQTDPIVADLAIDMQFSRRLSLITEIVGRSSLPADARKRATELWREAGKLAETRNTVAHNPMVFAPGPDKQVVPGIPNVRHMKGSGPFTITLLDVTKIINTARRLSEIVSELDRLLVEPNRNEQGSANHIA